MRKVIAFLAAAGMTLAAGLPALAQDNTITIWSQFADQQPNQQKALRQIFEDYQAAHPDVKLNVRFWDKAELNPAFQAAMLAGGKGAPDIVYYETGQADWIKAGWVDNIHDTIDTSKILAGYDRNAFRDYGVPVYLLINMLFYNPEVFDKLGIKVPADNMFTEEQFDQVIKTCHAGGYSGLANAAGDRPYAGTYIPQYMLLSQFGADEYHAYWTGSKSWDNPEIRKLLETYIGWIKDGLYPSTYSSMGIDAFHLYFHTLQKSCMLALGNWYTARAFKSEDAGGQSPDFHFSFLYYPEMDGAVDPKGLITAFAGFLGEVSTGTHKDIVKDVLKFMQQPKYGAMWTQVTASPSALRYTPSDVPDSLKSDPEIAKWSWYWDEIAKVYADADYVEEQLPCGEFQDALTTVFNDSIPLGTMTLDEAIANLDAHLCPAN